MSLTIERFQGRAGRGALIAAPREQKIVVGNAELAEKIAETATLIEIAPGTTIIEQNGDDNDLYLILVGTFDIAVNGRNLYRRFPNDYVGEMAAIQPTQRRSATVAATQFEDLCQHFESRSPTFIPEVRKKREQYLAFLNYPDSIRRSLSTTNVVEAVNGQIEIMRRNSGGYFHSQETLQLKLGLAVSQLEPRRWHRVAASVQNALDPFNVIFQTRFERDE